MKELYFKCECSMEILSVSYAKEYRDATFAMYSFGHAGNKLSLMERVKQCIYILKNGRAYTDQICLSETDMIRLADSIVDIKNEIVAQHKKDRE